MRSNQVANADNRLPSLTETRRWFRLCVKNFEFRGAPALSVLPADLIKRCALICILWKLKSMTAITNLYWLLSVFNISKISTKRRWYTIIHNVTVPELYC